MSLYNCPNCGAPIGLFEVCPYCGTLLRWKVDPYHVDVIEHRFIIRKLAASAFVDRRCGETQESKIVQAKLALSLAQKLPEVWRLNTDVAHEMNGNFITASLYIGVEEARK